MTSAAVRVGFCGAFCAAASEVSANIAAAVNHIFDLIVPLLLTCVTTVEKVQAERHALGG